MSTQFPVLARSRLVLFCVVWTLVAAISTCSDLNLKSYDSLVEVDNGRKLAVALASSQVTTIIITTSFTLADSDWADLGEFPLNIDRNVTIAGNAELVERGDLPAINCSFVKNKLRLSGGVVFTITGVVLTWYREDLPSSTPGLDLLDFSLNTTGPMPVLVGRKMALNNRLCFPESWSRQSVNCTKRPDEIPGAQNNTFDMPQPGCRNEQTGPWLTRCYGARRLYVDSAAYGAVFSDSLGRFAQTGYLVHTIDVDLLCTDVMSEECVQKSGTLGCYYSVFPRNKNSARTQSTGAGGRAEDKGAAAARRRRTILMAVLCPVLGGAVIVVAAVLAVGVVRRRRRRLRGGQFQADAKSPEPADGWLSHRKCSGDPDGARLGPSGGRRESNSGGALGPEQRHTICLDVKAPPSELPGSSNNKPSIAAVAKALAVARSTAAGADAALQYANGGGGGGDGKGSAVPVGKLGRRRCSSDLGGGDSGEQTAVWGPLADADMPVTLQTPPRPDMALLADPFTPADNEVKLLPNATRGTGSFGRVVEGIYQGQRVAVKLVADVYQWGGPSETLLRSFAQEVEVLCRCQHPNVVRLLAACLSPPRVCLVMELMETSLERLMYPLPEPPAVTAAPPPRPMRPQHSLLPLTTVLHVALEISKGLEYLHPTIIHRDLKPGNVLLSDPANIRPVVKLTDFGISRLRSTDAPTLTPGAGTPAYLAPEGLDPMNHVITHKADIYSLAVLLWEMVVGERPWREYNLMEMAMRVTLQGVRLPLEHIPDSRCPPKLRLLISSCWDGDPRRRPAAAEVVKSLALILQEHKVASEGGQGSGGGASGRGSTAAGVGVPAEVRPRSRESGGSGGGGDAVDAAGVGGIGPKELLPAASGGCCGNGGGCAEDGGDGGRVPRVLERKPNTAEMVVARVDAAHRVAPEALRTSAKSSAANDGGTALAAAPPCGGSGGVEFNQPQLPLLPSPPEPHGCGPLPGPTVLAVHMLFGKKSNRRGGGEAADMSLSSATPSPGGGDGCGGASMKPVRPQELVALQPLQGSSGCGALQDSCAAGPGARTVGFLGSSAFETWTGEQKDSTAIGTCTAATATAAAPPLLVMT